MKDYIYLCKGINNQIKAQKILFSKGYSWPSIDYEPRTFEDEYVAFFAMTDQYGKHLTFTSSDGYEKEYEGILRYCKNKPCLTDIRFFVNNSLMETE